MQPSRLTFRTAEPASALTAHVFVSVAAALLFAAAPNAHAVAAGTFSAAPAAAARALGPAPHPP